MAETRNPRQFAQVAWVVTLLGCALWTYGYFVGGSPSIIDWPAIAPHWIADYLPNWQAEVGLALTLLGSIPLYYAQIQDFRQRE